MHAMRGNRAISSRPEDHRDFQSLAKTFEKRGLYQRDGIGHRGDSLTE
jgi:hypothetical protein